jgi:1-acyl-sn-glycerol-3-phosphate acyltransferase
MASIAQGGLALNGSFRHRLIYRILRPVLSPVLKLRFRYRFDRVVPRHSPCIVLCNHTTSWDPILISLAFPQPMYFVASEHIFRWGLLSKLIVFLQAPIARLKATADTSAVRQVLRRLQEGHSVCIFPEGCCTYSGETSPISAAIGKLVRHSGAGLVTYRIEGGYFTDPRWAQKTRRGPMRGVFVREYGPEALSAMNAAEINEAIARDLSYNAYETKGSAFAYTGRRLAQWLETGPVSVPRMRPAENAEKQRRFVFLFLRSYAPLPAGRAFCRRKRRRAALPNGFGLVPMAEAPFLSIRFRGVCKRSGAGHFSRRETGAGALQQGGKKQFDRPRHALSLPRPYGTEKRNGRGAPLFLS